MPAVSVIMNCFNSARYLRDAIESVYAQTFSDWEIVFWDNASTDGSARIARAFDGKIRYFRGQATVPLGQARNMALAQARGTLIAFLDCDDVWLPTKLAAQAPLFDADPRVGLVYCNADYIDALGRSRNGTFFDRFAPRAGDVFFDLLTGPNFIPCVTAVLRRDVCMQAGGFRAELTNGEEYELFLRVARDYAVRYVDASLAKYRQHAGNFIKRNWIAVTLEEIAILESATRELDGLTDAQAAAVRKKLRGVFAKSVLKHVARGRVIRVVPHALDLTRRYRGLSAHLRRCVRVEHPAPQRG